MSNWSLFNHNYNLIGADKPPVWPENSPLPQCVPYACDALENYIVANNGWVMNDPEILAVQPIYFTGGDGTDDLRLSTVTQGGFPPSGGSPWDIALWHDTSVIPSPPEWCTTDPRFNTVTTYTAGASRCFLTLPQTITATITPDFYSTHIMVGTNASILLEHNCQYITNGLNRTYFIDMRTSVSVQVGAVTIGFQGDVTNYQDDIGPPTFDINKPYVVTTRVSSVQRTTGGLHVWDMETTVRIAGFGGTMEHTITDTSSAHDDTSARANSGTGYINLFRSGEAPGVDSLGVLYGDYYDGAWIAVQRNYSNYQLPTECYPLPQCQPYTCDALQQTILAIQPWGYWPCDEKGPGGGFGSVPGGLIESSDNSIAGDVTGLAGNGVNGGVGISPPPNLCAGVTWIDTDGSGMLIYGNGDVDNPNLTFGISCVCRARNNFDGLRFLYGYKKLANQTSAYYNLNIQNGSCNLNYESESQGTQLLLIASVLIGRPGVNNQYTVNIDSIGMSVWQNDIFIGSANFNTTPGFGPAAYGGPISASADNNPSIRWGAGYTKHSTVNLVPYTPEQITSLQLGWDRNNSGYTPPPECN
jgi:hypothetical protein